MAYAIPSSDILSICLVLSDCDLDASIARVIERVEGHQRDHDCHFGVTETDFRMAMLRLGLARGEVELAHWEHVWSALEQVPLCRWVQPMLAYNNAYFNDEGESWDMEAEIADCAEYNRPFREFFAQPATLTRETIAAYLAERGITVESVYRWTEQGQREL
ncbi:MAG: hypothetical protein M1546_26155 [Chloroflexi bacterium]|nr:hypothetical protein [Chloroflexota bacterium]